MGRKIRHGANVHLAIMARRIAGTAVHAGKLVRPNKCSACGIKTFLIVAHHDDYEKPLDIRWLCVICHEEWHWGFKP